MSNLPDISQDAYYRGGNAIFDRIHVLDKIVYNFATDDITTRNLTVTGIATSGENNEEQIHIDKNASPMRRYSHYNCILFICFSNYHRPPSVPLPSFHVCNFLETKMATATL